MLRKLVTGKNKLAREITLTLIIKVTLIYTIWYLFFSNPVDDSLTEEKVRSQIFGMTQSSPHNERQSVVDTPNSIKSIDINVASIEESPNGR
jgi:hypothetical protein